MMEVYVSNIRPQIIATGLFATTTERYWAERAHAQSLIDAYNDVNTLLVSQSSEIIKKLIVAEMDREWNNSFYATEREAIRRDVIGTIVSELSRIGVKITKETRDGVVVDRIATESMDELRETVRRLYPGMTPYTRIYGRD